MKQCEARHYTEDGDPQEAKPYVSSRMPFPEREVKCFSLGVIIVQHLQSCMAVVVTEGDQSGHKLKGSMI